jgi:hypothetical protein
VHRAGGPATPPSGATINRELLVLGKLLKLGHRGRLLVHVPHIEKLEEAPPRSGFVSVDQFETIRKNLAPDLQLAVVLGFTYGMRVSAVLGLDWERHVDFDSREIWLFAGETKNDDARSLPFTDEIEVLLNEQRARIAAHGDAIKDRTCVFPILPGERVPAKLVGTRRRGFARAWLRRRGPLACPVSSCMTFDAPPSATSCAQASAPLWRRRSAATGARTCSAATTSRAPTTGAMRWRRCGPSRSAGACGERAQWRAQVRQGCAVKCL